MTRTYVPKGSGSPLHAGKVYYVPKAAAVWLHEQGYAYPPRFLQPKRRRGSNPAKSAAQYGAAEAVLAGMSDIMPRKVARELVDRTPAALRSKYAKQLAARRRKNPATVEEMDAAARMYQRFHGRKAGTFKEYDQLRVTQSALTDCGRLVELVFKRPGFKREVYNWGDSCRIRVACTADGGQLYFVGGDQEIPLRGAGFDLPKDQVSLGDLVSITYHTSKDFHNFEPSDYEHKFGDEGGALPTGGYDVHSKRLYLLGGAYHVRREGIVG